MIPTQNDQLIGAAHGLQLAIKGTNTDTPGTLTRQDLGGNAKGSTYGTTPLAGLTLGAGTYYYFLPTAGCFYLDVTLRLASGTAPTITLFKTLSDNISVKGSPVAIATLVAAAQATTSITDLRGERGCVLKIVAAAGFTLDQADHCSL